MADPIARAPHRASPADARRPSARVRGRVATIAAAALLALAACSGTRVDGGSGTGPAKGTTTLGSNESDPQPKAAVHALTDQCASAANIAITVNDNDHSTFQNSISAYLQGAPDDVVKWFAGERVRFFANQGLVAPIDDVWADIGDSYSDAFRTASRGDDGRFYFVPITTYPWVVMYRRSLFAANGYTVPATLAELTALGDRMTADGLVPIAFGDLDGWPAMGFFDILDLRLNGYDFHIGLMAGRERWSDPTVKAVFEQWRALLPYLQEGGPGRSWQDAARTMLEKRAGMFFLGTFATQQAPSPDVVADIGFFPFPTLGTAFDGENAIDAPINGFMLSRNPKSPGAAKAFLRCVATAAAQKTYTDISSGDVATVTSPDTSSYNAVQKDAAAIIAKSGRIAQFLDRDARPDFAGPSGMQGFLLSFLADPTQDLDAFLRGIQAYYDSLPAEK